VYIRSDDIKPIGHRTEHTLFSLKTVWHHQTKTTDCCRNTHALLMATELTFSWVTSGQSSDLSFLPPSILPSALVLTWQGCHREHQNKGCRQRDEGMQRRGTKWRTKALFGLKDELLCCGTVCWSRSEELDGEREIWGHCGVRLSLCPLSKEEDRERVSFDTFHRFSWPETLSGSVWKLFADKLVWHTRSSEWGAVYLPWGNRFWQRDIGVLSHTFSIPHSENTSLDQSRKKIVIYSPSCHSKVVHP